MLKTTTKIALWFDSLFSVFPWSPKLIYSADSCITSLMSNGYLKDGEREALIIFLKRDLSSSLLHLSRWPLYPHAEASTVRTSLESFFLQVFSPLKNSRQLCLQRISCIVIIACLLAASISLFLFSNRYTFPPLRYPSFIHIDHVTQGKPTLNPVHLLYKWMNEGMDWFSKCKLVKQWARVKIAKGNSGSWNST